MSGNEHPPFYRQNSYEINSGIMLSAIVSLSAVVFLIVLLHIYARCMLSRRNARRQVALRHLSLIPNNASIIQAALPLKTGLDPSAIATLPTFMFKQENKEIECAVCLSTLEEGEMARVLPNCKHTFHVNCIDTWLGSNSTCPICRTEAVPKRLVAEPREGIVLPAFAPPSHESTSDCNGAISSDKVIGSSSTLSSFRKILSRERSSRRIQVQSCGHDHDGLPDLERQ